MMKRILLSVLCLGLVAGAVTAQVKDGRLSKASRILNGLYEIPKTAIAPVIDGIQDPVWKTLDWNFQTSYGNGSSLPDDWADLFGAHKMMYDDNNLYCLFYTQDENPTGNDATAVNWQRNGVEIYLDGDNSKLHSVVAPDHHLTFRHEHIGNEANSDWDVEGGLDTTGIVWKFRDDPNMIGYWFELKVPLDAVHMPNTAGSEIGIEFQQNDNDGSGREHISKWHLQTGDDSWLYADLWGTGILTDRVVSDKLEIKKVPAGSAPTIDGDLDPIYLKGNPVTQNSHGNGSAYPDDFTDAFVRTYVLYDDDNLYVFFQVNDENPTGNDPQAVNWQRNGVEIYLDGDNSKLHSAVAPDHHLTFRHEHIGNEANSDWDVEGGLDTTGLVWKIKDRPAGTGFTEAGGYNVELKVPLAAVHMPNTPGSEIGFEVQQNDNDGSGRESISKWWLESGDDSWLYADLWGTAILGSEIVVGVEENPATVVNDFSLEQNYPNPFNPSTKIQYTLKSTGKVRLSVYDLMGREVAVLANGVKGAGRHEVTFSGADLTSGIYFYRLQTAKEVITKKMALVK